MSYSISAFFGYDSILHDVDIVRFIEDMQGMGYQYATLIGKGTVEKTILKNGFTHICIHGREAVIEQDNI